MSSLRENINWLVARPAQSMSENVTSIAILNAVVIQTSGIVLSARSGIRSLIQIISCYCHLRFLNNRIVIMKFVSVCSNAASA